MTAAVVEQPEVAAAPPGGLLPDRQPLRTFVRKWRWLIVLILLGVVLALIAGRPASGPSPLSPSSTQPDGTKALVLLLRGLGAEVSVGASVPSGPGVALLLQDHLNPSDRAALDAWVSRGNTLIVTDLTSPIVTGTQSLSVNAISPVLGGERLYGEGCVLAPLQSVTDIQPEGGDLLADQSRTTGCFGTGGYSFVQASPQGAGTMVVLGGPDPWINANLGRADNAELAAALLAPNSKTHVTVVGKSRVGGGSSGLFALISPRVKEMLWQLGVAFVLLVIWRARRLGRPVPEDLPVEIPGSELVAATANLLHEGGHRGRAAEALRADLGRTLRRRLGIPSYAGDAEVAATAASRTGISEALLEQTLAGPAPANDEELVRLSETIEEIRQEMSRADR